MRGCKTETIKPDMMDMMGECCVIKANHAVNAPNANGFVPTPPAGGVQHLVGCSGTPSPSAC